MPRIRDPQLISWELVKLAENRRMSKRNRELFRDAAKKLRDAWLLDVKENENDSRP